jgi:hypothetical protein
LPQIRIGTDDDGAVRGSGNATLTAAPVQTVDPVTSSPAIICRVSYQQMPASFAFEIHGCALTGR